MELPEQQIRQKVRKLTQDQAFNLQGRIPPQNKELEEAVLGALMLDMESRTKVIDTHNPDFFYFYEHQLVFNAIVSLNSRMEPVDILTVIQELRATNKLDLVGGAYAVQSLASRVVSAANVEFHARIVAQKYIQRELIRISTQITKDSYDETADVIKILEDSEQQLLDISEKNFRSDYSDMSALVASVKEGIENAGKETDGISGVPSGFKELDRHTGGFQKGNLVVIAARPGMGKTAFALSLVRNVAVDHKRPIAFFSLEMTSEELVARLCANQTQLPQDKLKKGNLESYEWQQFNTKVDDLLSAPIYFDDSPQLTIFELRAKCRRLKMKHDIQMVAIDYLQLMQGTAETRGNRQEEISTISRQLKALAKELKVPIIALSQLSRNVENRGGDKRPLLSDLRDSGAIEQDADMVMFIYRPGYYGILEDNDHSEYPKDYAELNIAKHRNGSTAVVELRTKLQFAQFLDPDHDAFEAGNNFAMTYSSAFDEGDNKPFVIRPSKLKDDQMPY